MSSCAHRGKEMERAGFSSEFVNMEAAGSFQSISFLISSPLDTSPRSYQ